MMRFINLISNYRHWNWVIPVFCTYVFFMSYMFFYYKSLSPAFHSTVTKGRPYLVDTEGYKLPDFDPFDSSVLRYLRDPPKIDCSDGKRPLTTGVSNYLVSNSSEGASAVIMHKEHIEDYSMISFSCCYQAIRRDASRDPNFEVHSQNPAFDYPDAKFFLEKRCHSLKSKVTIVNEEAVLVQCSSSSRVFYQNIHLFVPPKQRVAKNEAQLAKNSTDCLNVMILGIDSVSRLNLQRYMPKTFAYLKETALDLKGFNRNYENTYPNLLAMTTGYDSSKKETRNYIEEAEGYYDEIPFIWKDFSAAGYTTFYGEDCSSLGTFAYKYKKGFSKPPTDYYFRSYIKAVEDILGSNEGYVWISGCKLCGASKLLLQHILDYAETISKTFGKRNPYFSLLWTSSLTHDRLHFAGAADEPVVKFLRNMNENGHWNNTIVFLMSDHGIRFGGIRETYIGKKEESLPMNYIIVPQWFKKKFPIAYENLVYNQDRLTTTMDLYETLMDIVKERYKDEDYLEKEHSVSEYRLSLFRKISSSRTCFSAKIPLNYCAGQIAVEMPETFLVRLAARSILLTLNRGLAKFPVCRQLTDFRVKKSFILQFYEVELKNDHSFYEIQMTSFPGQALLEGIVEIKFSNGTFKPTVIGEISRINEYVNQSYCINDVNFVKYCFCKKTIS